MDQPQRANAAQLAARNIKAKPKSRANRPGFSSQPGSANAVPQFAPMPQQGTNSFNSGGSSRGLFGGAVQAPSTFNFSTNNGPSLSFPPTNFGSSNTFGGNQSPAPESERVEDSRNPKRQFQGASQSGQQNATFQTPNIFGQQNGSANPFAPAAPASNGFSFGNSQPSVNQSFPPTATPGQSASNPFNFAPAAAPAPKSPFTFAPASTQSPAQAPSSLFNFGNTNTTPAKPADAPFSFGQTNTTSAASVGSTPTTSAPASSGWNFNSTTAPGPASSGINFNSTPTTSAPASSGFSFNPTPAAAAPASPAINFGSKPTASAPAASAPFSFGSTATTSAPTNNLFGKTPSQPGSPSTNLFGATTQSQSPNPFAHLNQPTPSPTEPLSKGEQSNAKPETSYFGSQTQKPAASPFQFGSQEQKPATPTTNAFTGQQSTPAPVTTNLFGGQQPAPSQAPATNFFGSLGQTPVKPTNDLFSNSSATPANTADSSSGNEENTAPKTDLFGTQGQNTPKPASSLFQNTEKTPAKASSSPFSFGQTPAKNVDNVNVFNTTPQAPPKPNPFANLNKPASALTASNGASESASKPATNGMFGNASTKATGSSSSNLFGNTTSPAAPASEPLSTLNQPLNQPAPQASTTLSNGAGNNTKPVTNVFSMNKAQPPPSQSTSSPQQPAPAQAAPLLKSTYSAHVPHTPAVSSRLREVQSAEGDNIDKDVDAPEEPLHPESFVQSLGQNGLKNIDGDPQKYPEQFPGMEYASRYPIEKMDPLIPDHFTTDQKLEFYYAYRMRALNKALQRYFNSIGLTDNIFPAIAYYNSLREVILQRTAPDLKLQSIAQSETSKAKSRAKPASPVKERNQPAVSKPSDASKNTRSSQPSLNGNTPSLPPPQSSFFKSAPSLPPPQSSPAKASPSPAPSQPPQPSLPKFNPTPSSQSLAPSPSASKGKRKGEDFTKDDFEASEASSPLKRAKMQSSTGSNTSNLFKNALNSPAKPLPAQGALEKAAAATPEKPKVNPFAKLPGTSSPAKPGPPPAFSFGAASTTPKASPAKAAAAPSFSFGTESTTPKASPAKPMFSGFPTPAAAAPASAPKAATGGSSNFLAQFGAKAKDDEAANEKKLMQRAMDEDYDSDDDKEEWIANYKKKRAEELNALKAIKDKPTSAIPSVSGSVNFLSQFGAKAKDDEAANEKKLMQRAMDEDYDSDDDKEEWIANYKKKRAEELKALEEAKKTATGFSLKPKSGSSESKPAGGFVFKPSSDTSSEKSKSSGFVFKPTESSSSQAAKETSTKSSPFPSVAQPKPLLGQSATAKSSGSSVFESLNSTRAPTPTFSFGAPVPDTQTTAPVFEGLFGHLSKQNSEEGSNKENSDEDDDGHESDSENKDPNYDPKKDKNPDSPSTPVEETGAGIASTKKATNPFSFGSSTPTPAAKTGSLFGTPSNSGTTTPKPSLFDRITRDSNGQPVKDTSEEKENTKPAPTNLFGSLNKAPGSPADQTWKPDTPIKFGGNGASTDENSSLKPANPFGSLFGTAPAVTVQAATPTKPAAPFGNLFGTSKPATANGSGTSTPSLFAGLNAPKPGASTVGFGFGAASGSSSLFPSAAASTTTSRATTPGGTTDGDSAAENADPDAEKHAQLDLSEQAPGEEDEKRLFEIRAKASKYDNNAWSTKGTGLLRVLKHNDTNNTRILIRTDIGNIVLNKSLLSGVDYVATQKTVKLMTASEDGKGLETWILQVKTADSATKLAETLEANKADS